MSVWESHAAAINQIKERVTALEQETAKSGPLAPRTRARSAADFIGAAQPRIGDSQDPGDIDGYWVEPNEASMIASIPVGSTSNWSGSECAEVEVANVGRPQG